MYGDFVWGPPPGGPQFVSGRAQKCVEGGKPCTLSALIPLRLQTRRPPGAWERPGRNPFGSAWELPIWVEPGGGIAALPARSCLVRCCSDSATCAEEPTAGSCRSRTSGRTRDPTALVRILKQRNARFTGGRCPSPSGGFDSAGTTVRSLTQAHTPAGFSARR